MLVTITVNRTDDTSHLLHHPVVQHMLEVGSMVQFGDPLHYGVIAKIIKDPYSNEEFAELETVSMHKLPHSKKCLDGKLLGNLAVI